MMSESTRRVSVNIFSSFHTARICWWTPEKEVPEDHGSTLYGRYVVTGRNDSVVQLWDIQTGKEIRQFVGHTDGVRYAIFSPDGVYLLTASHDHTARLWRNSDNTVIGGPYTWNYGGVGLD